MLWHEQQWPILRRIDKNNPVIIPLGSLEQHGPHLPIFVDTIQVTAIAEAVEKMLSDQILLLPTLWLGSSHHHIDFTGTISVRPALYSKIIKSISDCLLTHGFRRIMFLNGHGGNQVPAAQALSELVTEDERADDAYLLFSSWWQIGKMGIDPRRHGLQTPMVSHACEYETSFLLALRPELVRQDKIPSPKPALKSDWFEFEYPGRSRVSVFRRYRRQTALGALGQPKHATKEKGEAMFAAVVDEIVAFLKDFRTWPELKALGPAESD